MITTRILPQIREPAKPYLVNGSAATQTAQARVKQLEAQLTWLTHLCRLLAARLTTELVEDPDDDIAWVYSQLSQIDKHP